MLRETNQKPTFDVHLSLLSPEEAKKLF